MRFSKQRFVIVVLFLMLPAVTALAFLQTPFVSEFVLQFALRVTRFRTGVHVYAQGWQVSLFSFSARLENVKTRTNGLVLECPSLDVKVSPISLLWGELGIRSLEINSPQLYGKIPQFKNSDSTSSKELNSYNELPEYLGTSLIGINKQLQKNNISFDRFVLKDARIVLSEHSISSLSLDFENYGDGQARVQWRIEDGKFEGYLTGLKLFEGSVVVLRSSRKQFDLIVPRWSIALQNKNESLFEVTGRWPGELVLRSDVDLSDIEKIAETNKKLSENLPKNLKGKIVVDGRLGITGAGLQKYGFSVSAKGLELDGYYPNDLSLEASGDLENMKIQKMVLGLPPDLGDLPQWNQKLKADLISVDLTQKTFVGKWLFDEVGLCSVLKATAVYDCPVSLKINGDAEFQGNLSPFAMTARPKFYVTETLVEGVEIPNYPTTSAVVRVNPFVLNGIVEVYADHLDLFGVKLIWNQKSEAITDGRIDFNPTIVSLKSYGEKMNLRDMTHEFIGIQPEGEGRIQSDVYYNSETPPTEGRTQVEARVSLDGVGLEKQTFGLLSGPLSYKKNRLFIGPLKLTKGGGKADIEGELWESKTGPRLKLSSQIDRIEVLSKIDEIEKDLFRGFVSGSVDLEGSTRPDDSDFLNGSLKIKTNAFSFLGIPFQRGSGDARYEKQVLKISNFVAENKNSKVNIMGELQPVKGTEVLFSSDSIPVSALKINSGLNELQDAKLRMKGFWKPAVGWGVKGTVFDLANGGRKFPDAQIEVGGDGQLFNVDVQMVDLLKLSYQDKLVGPSEKKIQKMYASLKDGGFYALFSFLKGWKSETQVNSKGLLQLDWTPAAGSIKTQQLEITGPSKRDGKIGPLFVVPGNNSFVWRDSQVVQNTFDRNLSEKSPTPFSLLAADGSRSAQLTAKIPAAFGDLFIPNMNFLEGTLVVDANIPMNPDINTTRIKGSIQNAILLVRGLGKPVEEFNSEVLVSGKSLFVNQGRGRLGSGEVVCNGVYRLDIENPAASFQFNLNRAQMVLMDDVPLDVSGDVSLKGDVFPYELSGRAQVSNALYAKEFQGNSSLISPDVEPVLNYNLDVDLLQDVRVKNSVSDLVVGGKVVLSGNDLYPEIKGKVQILSGKVFANENVFQVSQGAVDFVGGTPIVPIVNLQGATALKADNVDYRIDLKIRGTSNDLSFDFTSDPSLETSQIINLLAFGMVKRSDDSLSLTSDLAGAARVEAFQALFGKALGKNLDTTTGFQVKFRAAPDQSQKEFIPKVMVTRKLSDRVTATFGNSLDLDKPEKNFQVDYRLFNNVNLTGVWEQGANPQDSSMGMDLRFKFELK